MASVTEASKEEEEVILEAADMRVLSSGNTGDPVVTATRMRLAVNDTLLLDGGEPAAGVGGSLTLLRGHRYGLVGENGAGKTTLMRALRARCEEEGLRGCVYVGQTDAEAGEIDPKETVLEYCKKGRAEDRAVLVEELEYLEGGEVEDEDGETNAEVIAARIEELCELLDNLEVTEQRALESLRVLGFKKEIVATQKAAELSGGWRTRLELARAVAQRPRLLFLDEPTNHLDVPAVLRLALLLRGDLTSAGEAGLTDCTTVVVSHDAAFLDLVATDMLVLSWQRLQQVQGGFSEFEAAAEQYKTAMEGRYAKRVAEEKRQKASVEKVKKNARKAGNDKALKQAASRERKAESRIGLYRDDGKRFKTSSLKKLTVSALRVPARAAPVRQAKGVTLMLPQRGAPPQPGTNLLSCDNLGLSYGGGSVLDHVILSLCAGDRVGLVGTNGQGKSTLIAALAGEGVEKSSVHEKSKKSGENDKKGEALRIERGSVQCRGSVAVLGQSQLAALEGSMHLSPVGLLARHSMFEGKESPIRAHLAHFGIAGDVALSPIAELSGGLRVRVLLADLFAVTPAPNILLLDEPTNHLDADTLAALAASLRTFPGAVLTVSHSIAFLLEVCDILWVCHRGKVEIARSSIDKTTFQEALLSYAKGCVPAKHHGAVEKMMTARAARSTMAVQQQLSITSLLV